MNQKCIACWTDTSQVEDKNMKYQRDILIDSTIFSLQHSNMLHKPISDRYIKTYEDTILT